MTFLETRESAVAPAPSVRPAPGIPVENRRIAERLLRGGNWKDLDYANPEVRDWTKVSEGTRVRLPVRKLKDKTLATAPGVEPADNPPPRPEDQADSEPAY